jgi:Sodium Bile acid symporter family
VISTIVLPYPVGLRPKDDVIEMPSDQILKPLWKAASKHLGLDPEHCDLIMLVLFVPIVQFLVHGASSLVVPFNVLLTSVVVFIVVPLLVGIALRMLFLRRQGRAWFEGFLLPKFAPVTIAALLGTLVLIFAFQADNNHRPVFPCVVNCDSYNLAGVSKRGTRLWPHEVAQS